MVAGSDQLGLNELEFGDPAVEVGLDGGQLRPRLVQARRRVGDLGRVGGDLGLQRGRGRAGGADLALEVSGTGAGQTCAEQSEDQRGQDGEAQGPGAVREIGHAGAGAGDAAGPRVKRSEEPGSGALTTAREVRRSGNVTRVVGASAATPRLQEILQIVTLGVAVPGDTTVSQRNLGYCLPYSRRVQDSVTARCSDCSRPFRGAHSGCRAGRRQLCRRQPIRGSAFRRALAQRERLELVRASSSAGTSATAAASRLPRPRLPRPRRARRRAGSPRRCPSPALTIGRPPASVDCWWPVGWDCVDWARVGCGCAAGPGPSPAGPQTSPPRPPPRTIFRNLLRWELF